MALNLQNIAKAIALAISSNEEWSKLLGAARAAKWETSEGGKKIPPQEFIKLKDLLWSFKLITSDKKEFIVRKELVNAKAKTSKDKYKDFNEVFSLIFREEDEVQTQFSSKDLGARS